MPGSPMRSLHMCSGSAACCRAAPLSGHRCVEATRSTLACQMPAQGLPARNFTLALRTAAWHMYLVTGKLAAVVCQQHEGKGLSGAGSGCGVASVHTPQQSAGNASILHATCTGCTEQDKHGFLGEPARICVWAIANVRLNICITGYLAAAKKRIAATPYPTNLLVRAHLCTPLHVSACAGFTHAQWCLALHTATVCAPQICKCKAAFCSGRGSANASGQTDADNVTKSTLMRTELADCPHS